MTHEVLSAVQVATIRDLAAGDGILSLPRAGLNPGDMRHVGGILLTLADSHEALRVLVEELLDVALPYLSLWEALMPASNAEGEIARRWVQALRQAQAALDGVK